MNILYQYYMFDNTFILKLSKKLVEYHHDIFIYDTCSTVVFFSLFLLLISLVYW